MDYPRLAGGIPVVAFDAIGSTNAEGLERARNGEHGPLWIAAKTQTGGRGRRGRAWISEPGNLYTSLLLTDPAPPAVLPGICFVAALALHDAVLDTTSGLAPASLKLKWPNDLLLDGKKIAGILVEGVSLGSSHAAVIGFGVNCKHHPEGTEFPAANLADAGFPVEPAALLALLAEAVNVRLKEWNRGVNFAAISKAWTLRAAGIGEAIEVRLPDRTIGGTFETLDSDGGLVLRRADGSRETIHAGDVFPLN
jgi:BirA family transcriptional regulator, biotin operon repressor / biotin---[acetyl-CoA-carboxylase] ligase